MNAMLTSTHPVAHHVPLTTGLAAAAEARTQVRAIVRAWQVPVDAYVVALLTSELVTNAVRNEADPTVMLDVTCSSTGCASMSTTRRAPCPRRPTLPPTPRPAGA